MSKKCLFAAAISITLLFIGSALWAATYYVDPNGDDSSGDGGPSKPWKSLSYASSQVTTYGDKIYLNAGTYMDNNGCTLSIGVDIEGAGKSVVTINTTADPYITASTNLPIQGGNNDIYGIKFKGNNSNSCFFGKGRNNQIIHDCEFEDFPTAIAIYGKYGWNHAGAFWDDRYDGNETTGPRMFQPAVDRVHNIPPANNEWGENIQIYSNSFIDCKIKPSVIKDSLIHDNIWDNRSSKRSGIGHTGLWFNHCSFYNNTFQIGDQSWHGPIGIEIWELKNECEIYNNISDSWFSLCINSSGNDAGYDYSYIVHDNTMINNGSVTQRMEAIEITNLIEDVLCYGNYIEGDAWSYGIVVWGQTKTRNITLRNNVIYDVHGDAIQIAASIDGSGSGAHSDVDDICIYNNVIDSPGNHGIYISGWDDSQGDVDNVVCKNNIIMNLPSGKYGLICAPSSWSSKVTGCEYRYNVTFGASGHVEANNANITVDSNHTWNPDLKKTANRPDSYYRPTGADANIVDSGTYVGLSYSGTSPDIGPYEYNGSGSEPPSPPTGLTVVSE